MYPTGLRDKVNNVATPAKMYSELNRVLGLMTCVVEPVRDIPDPVKALRLPSGPAVKISHEHHTYPSRDIYVTLNKDTGVWYWAYKGMAHPVQSFPWDAKTHITSIGFWDP